MEEKRDFRTRLVYQTTNKIWAKVVMISTAENINNRASALDFLIEKGFEAWQNEQEEKAN